jgi:hypothetical protein
MLLKEVDGFGHDWRRNLCGSARLLRHLFQATTTPRGGEEQTEGIPSTSYHMLSRVVGEREL